MDIKITTKYILKVLHILSWIIFIGVCIEAGGSIFSAFFTLVINSYNAKTFWVGNDLSGLYNFGRGHFFTETLLISITSILKTCIFYLIIKILQDKKLRLYQPFNDTVRRFISKISWLAVGIGLITAIAVKYTAWLAKQRVEMPDTQSLRLGGADVWLFMGVILFVIAQVFKRGIEIQSENDLTV
jgi:magnesium-transporting ATPase (P-type)